MHRWTPLNERQLASLRRIADGAEPVTSDSPALALTARALKDRGLIAMPKAGGGWRAEITDVGRFYLEHGHHPDKPAHASRRKTPATDEAVADRSPAPARDPSKPSDVQAKAAKSASRPPARPNLEIPGPALIEKVQKAGRFLRIPNPEAADRARYRRAFDAARQCAPPGYHLKYSGRTKGDFFLGLLRISGEDDTEWNRVRLQRSRVISDLDDVLAAVAADHSAFEITDDVLPRVQSLLRLLAEEAENRLGDLSVSKKRKQPRPLLTVHGRTYEVSFKERQKPVRYVPTQPGRRRTYDWQRVTPQHRFEPSGELELHISAHGYYGWKNDWGDTPKKPLESQIGSVFRTLKTRAEEEERARLAREAEQRRLREELARKEEERRRQEAEERERAQREWEAVVGTARVKAVEAAHAKHFGTAFDQWRTAGEMRTFCSALRDAADRTTDPDESNRLRQWLEWGQAEADRLDPTVSGQGLSTRDFHREPTGDELRPFLDGWHPDRPEKEKPRAETAPPKPDPAPWQGINDVPRDQGWRYGRQGRAQWWRRVTPCPRRRSSSSARSTTFPRRVTSSRRATNSS
ncbi:PE-PGRS family protein [Streptomyces sp. NBC_01775]|uniref:PE-PGRS family protein n=2 Tax=unclassified Streptomyces TaxID=2593676 RepID=UPI003FA3C134